SEGRGQQILERLLEEIVRRQARFAILDLTGMGAVDAGCVGRLLSVSRAAGLLGCRCLLSGISGEVARRMIEAGANGADVPTFGRLKDALRYAMGERRRG
ncbi:MAG TPA: STAS domain-containing protein, partial [Candidatus Nanopelagicales bacterium]|nr:STAS domain-containing protein [Candidatus Nanopelagicales bacterium]